LTALTSPTAEGPKGRLAVGLVFIAFGLVLTLEQAGVVNFEGFGRFWPLLVIGIGIVKVRQPLEDGQRAVGTALLLVGGLFQILSVLSWARAWPLVFVAAGAFMLWQAVARPEASEPGPRMSPVLAELVLLGGSKRVLRVPDFRGGYVTAVLGGIELDLRKCGLGPAPAVLDVVAFWGGIDLKVPPEWTVEGKVVPILGGFDQSAAGPPGEEGPRLVVRGYAIMGGVAVGH
jgi:hypothetical protein